ncbi:MAG TPA: DUF2335 domain-containing protein [Candidatus Eremiobacteraceae bacterium]|nr:DUF2335 domain-containing protein [Candidatus Eremiobacteraceae bacterium]
MVRSQSTELRIQAASFSGPLPPPDALERYNQILPGAAERIIAMAENQHTHRQGLEKHVIHSNVAAQRLGTILGFIVAMTVVIGGMFLVHEGKSGEGLAAILTALASLVGVFLYSKHEQQKELAKKTDALANAAAHR